MMAIFLPFCRSVQDEAARFIEMLYDVYSDFGFTDLLIKLSTRPEKRIGTEAGWDFAEQALANALDAKNIPWEENPGEGAFMDLKLSFRCVIV